MPTKDELKEKFSTGKIPTGDDFAELIDGVEGPEGPQGPAGTDGTNGTNGSKGDPGTPGTDAEPQFTPEQVDAIIALIEVEA